jgi:hypothetical protein
MRNVGCFDGEHYSNFLRWEDFLNYVTQPKYAGLRWFSHNGGRYDSNALFDWLRANRPDMPFSFYCQGSAVVSLTLGQGESHWRFCDSYRLLDASLALLTQEFDVEHKKGKLSEAAKGSFADEITYNRNDCMGLYEVLTKFFDVFGAMAETVASFALQVFRLKFLKKTIYKTTRKVEDFIRRSYFGGRCEVYRWDGAELNKYDINSLYPSVMRESVPVEYSGFTREIPPDDNESMGFYEADIDYPEVYLPALPAVIGEVFRRFHKRRIEASHSRRREGKDPARGAFQMRADIRGICERAFQDAVGRESRREFGRRLDL